jgi:GNAT superfamily N-acetyltransferase
MQTDSTWPPRYARDENLLNEWLGDRSRLGRWVAIEGDGQRAGDLIRIVGHVGVDIVPEGNKADVWQTELGCDRLQLAEIGRLVVHPDRRRGGLSERLTRRCVRDTVSRGYVPVASALASASASLAMMTGLGWRVVGDVVGRRSGSTILLLVAPKQLIEAARAAHREDRGRAQ